MAEKTSIRWKEETAKRAKWMADAEDVSVSALISILVNERWAECYPEPPIEGLECPTCQNQADFVFMAYWEELEPGTKLYTCSECGTTKTEKTIREWNNGQKRPIAEKMEAVS